MGSIVQFRRRTPSIRNPASEPVDTSSKEETTSIRILLWTFGAAAIAMCATVVITLSRTWTEMLWISSFVIVFALLKIGLANALFIVMVRCDKERRRIVVARPPSVKSRRIRPNPRRAARLDGALSLAAIKKPARPSATPSPTPR